MDKPSSYCSAIPYMKDADRALHQAYHDVEYGFPLDDDDALFARLILEINQAGLSWTTILKKKDHFFRAYHGLRIAKVAAYGDRDIERLMQDAGIIRNRLKILAAIENAKRIRVIAKEHGSFRSWLDTHHPLTKDEWVKLFKKHFRFTGGEIVNEFLMSTGYLPGAHTESCPVYKKLLKASPAWKRK